MRIDVRQFQTCLLEPCNLRCGLGFDLVGQSRMSFGGPDAVCRRQKSEEGRTKAAGVRIGEIWDIPMRGENRLAVDEDDVAAYSEGWGFLRQRDPITGGRCVGHKGCAGQDTLLVQFDDGAIDARCQAEIVRIHNQLPHGSSLSTWAWRLVWPSRFVAGTASERRIAK